MASLALGVKFTPASTGAGSFVYSAAVAGFMAPSAYPMVNGKTYRYRAESADLSQWEFGSGVWTSGTGTLTRVVSFSSTGGTVSFSTIPQVGITVFPGDVLLFDDVMTLTAAQQAQARANIGADDAVTVKGYGASGSAQTTTGTIGAASNALTLASALDFANNQGILVFGAGASPTVGAPTLTAVAPINTTGATTYAYKIASLDNQGGLTAATAATTIATGFATLGTYLSGTSGIAMNQITWTVGTGTPLATVVWRSTSGGAYVLLGCFLGTSIFDTGIPTQTIVGIPTTPPASAVPGWLATTISSGAGTTALTLAANATTAAAGALVQHDDTAAINTAMAANVALAFPAGTYNVRGLQIPSTVQSVTGAGAGTSAIVSFAQTSDGLVTGVSAAMGGTIRFSMSGMKIVAANSMAYDGFTLSASGKAVIFGNEFAGARALRVVSCSNPTIIGNLISGWWNVGIFSDANAETLISGNAVTAISGQVGAVALTATPTGSGYMWGAGINCLGGFGETISSNLVFLFGGSWGISAQDSGGVITNNVIKYSGREAIVAGGATGPNFKVHGNYCYWNVAGNGNTSCYDFGMSMADDGVHAIADGDVSGNTFTNSGFSSIAIFGSGAGATYTNVTIGGNTIIGSNQLAAHTSGIELSGSNVSGILVDTNSFLSPGANMTFAVAEVNGGNGMPNGNTINTQMGSAGTSGLVSISGATSVYTDGFVAFTPTIVCGQATGTAVGTAAARYRTKGKKVEITIDVSISGTFTGGSLTSVSLPFPSLNATSFWVLPGRESATTGAVWMGTVVANASTMVATNYINSATIVTGQRITFTGWYERA
jgi:parallel beta-helix repeat protein